MLSIGRKLLLSAIFRATLVHSTPTLSFPINSQVPPVARIGEPFSFVFSDTTFTSSDGASISYSLTNPPAWLSLDSASRKFYGTPQDGDVGPGTVVGVDVTLVATDSTGFVVDDATLVVSRGQAPSVQVPMSEQIQTFGEYSEPSSILYSPEESFQFTFASDTFVDPDAPVLDYYAVLLDNSPLPAWLSFNAGTLAFTGSTPPFSSLVEPPQTFSVKLIASDVVGFSATSVNFSIVVGSHTLTTNKSNVSLNATAGEPLMYTELMGSIEANGQAIDSSHVDVTTRGLPSWLTFDPASWDISGTPPDTAESTAFTITIEDEYADILNITFSVQLGSADNLFQSPFPALTVQPGESFSFDLSSYLLDPSSLDVTTSVEPVTSWISWAASSLTLSGDAPTSARQSIVNVTFTVASKSGQKHKRNGASQSQQLVIQINGAAATTSSSVRDSATPTSSTSSAATSTAAATTGDGVASTTPTKWIIIAAVISVVAFIAIVVSLSLWCCGRKKKKNNSKRNSSSTLSSIILSNPFPDETYVHTPDQPDHTVDLQRTTTASPIYDNEKLKRPPTVWKASALRRELSFSPAPAGFSLGAIYTTTTNDDLPPSIASTPRMRKIKDLFTSIRSLRVVNALPLNRRTSTGSSLAEDEGRSPNVHQGTGFGFDLESASGGPPVIQLSHSSEVSLRDALEGSLHPTTQDSSLQITPEAVYSADRQQQQRKQQEKQWRMSRLNSQRQQNRRSVQNRVATPGVLRPQSKLQHRLGRDPVQSGNRADPFSDLHVSGTSLTPISLTPYRGDTHDPFNSNENHTISPITPTSPADRPSLPIPSSSVLPKTSTTKHPSRPLRPAHSQKSVASTASSSLSAQSRKIGRKVSASAKGAIYALQSPKRRTYAALRKHSSNGGAASSSNDNTKRMQSGRRKKRPPVLGDDDSTAANTPNLGDERSVSSPTAGRDRGSSSYTGGSGGLAGYLSLSPRAWPQPASSAQRNMTVPQSRAEQHQEQSMIRRRPVPSTSTAAWGASISSASDLAGVVGSDMLIPSPLCTPIRGASGVLKSSPYGLGISHPDMYADIAGSSPFPEEENNWAKVGGDDDEDDDDDGSPTGWGRRQQQRAAEREEGGGVGRAIGGEEEGDGRVKSGAGLSMGSKASSGVAYL